MEDPESDLASRGRALFAQLRGAIQPRAGEDHQAEDPAGGDHLAGDPGAEERPAEEPRTEEPPADDPGIEEPRTEEPRPDDPGIEEPRTEEPPAEAPRAEEPPAEESPEPVSADLEDESAADTEPEEREVAEPVASAVEELSPEPTKGEDGAAVPMDAGDIAEDETVDDEAAAPEPPPVEEPRVGQALTGNGSSPAVVESEPHVRPAHPAAELPLPRVVAVANQKGGVGKTTTAVNLGAALAELGYRTLVVDLDPQGNATTGLGINARNLEHSVYDVLMHELPLDESVEPTTVRNLFVVPATIDLAGAEIELVPAFSRELRLRRALAETADSYDFTIIDCPPSLGLLTINGLAAATEVLVPIQCEYYALEGLSQLIRNVNLVQSNLNPALILSAIVLTMYDARTKLADQVAAEVRSHFGARVCRHVVPRTVRLSEAPSYGQPIIVFDPSSRGALAYREVAKEVSGGAPQRAG